MAESVWERLRQAQDELDTAIAERPTRHGSEQMQVDELAGDSLPLLLTVVEAAASYRETQRAMKRNPSSGRADLNRSRDWLDKALDAVHPQSEGV